MYVQLLADRQIDVDGGARLYHRGDWVDLGKQTALRWIAEGSARVSEPSRLPMPEGCAIVTRGNPLVTEQYLKASGYTLPLLSELQNRSNYQRILLWESSYKLRGELLPVGFGFLERFEVAAPLWSYRELAADLGDSAEREATRTVIRDLRVPCYDPRLLFLRCCPTTDQLLAEWPRDRGDERLSFLRAIYAVKPLILALPVNWERGREGAA